MSSWLRRCALCLVLLSLPALATPHRENVRAARIRASSSRPDTAEVQAAEVTPIAAAAADAGGVDLAGLLGMLAALAVTYVYARGQRLAPGRRPVNAPAVLPPPDRH